MLNILVLTKNNPIEIQDVIMKLNAGLGELDQTICVISPQATALLIEQVKGIPYTKGYYPAMRAHRNRNKFAEDNNIDCLVTVGSVDIHSFNEYDAIVGIDNPNIDDYIAFDEDFNTDNIISSTLKSAEIMFNTVDEIIHFIRVVRKNKEKENNN